MRTTIATPRAPSTAATPSASGQLACAALSDTQLESLLAAQPEDVQAEITRINTEARTFALQVALLVPLLAGVLGFPTSFRMMRQPDVKPSAAIEGMLAG